MKQHHFLSVAYCSCHGTTKTSVITLCIEFLPLDEAMGYRAVFVIVSRTGGWVGNAFEPAMQLKNGRR